MTRFLPIILFFAVAAATALAQQTAIPTKPELTVSLEPRHVKTRGAYVQGQIVLRVQLVSPYPFEALKLNLPPIVGARTLTLSPPQTHTIHNYALKGYLYETRLAVFPKQSGALTIPSISVVGAVSIGSGQKKSFTEINLERIVPVRPIDPGYDADWWLVADAATIAEVWAPPPEALRVGDVVRRDITLTVYGVTAEHLPVIEQAVHGGYSVVGSKTTTKTNLAPEGVIATVHRLWDLRIDSEEVISISPIRLAFWNPATDAMAFASLPAKRIEPLPRDANARRAKLMNDAITEHRNRRIGLFAVLSIPGLALLTLLLVTLYKSLPTRADRHLSRICAENSTPTTCFRAIAKWSRDSFGTDGSNLIGPLQQKLGGEAANQLGILQRALFSAADVPTEPKRLVQSLVRAARRCRLREFRQQIIHRTYRQISYLPRYTR